MHERPLRAPSATFRPAGIRRITAVTAERAEEAREEARSLASELAAATAVEEPDEAALTTLKERLDLRLPAVERAQLRGEVRALPVPS